MISYRQVTSIQVICGREVPIADTAVMDMSANCYVPAEGLISPVFPMSQTRIYFFSRGLLMKTDCKNILAYVV